MKLTRRQEEFIHKLLDLTREMQAPIHYSRLAERLGVSPFTAYDMLRLLEEKGLVASEYQLNPDKSGPGRTERVFRPTRRAFEILTRLTEEMGGADWEAFKQRVLEKGRTGEIEGRDLAEEMLSRVPSDGQGSLRYCVEVMTVIAIRLRSSSGRRVFVAYLPEILPAHEPASRANLALLGGFALGILAGEDSGDRDWERQLFEHVQSYLDIVTKISTQDCHLLGEYLIKVFSPLQSKS